MRKAKFLAKHVLYAVHRIGLRLGFVILPLHFYIPFPDIIRLRRDRDLWARRSDMVGVDADLDAQVAALRRLVAPHQGEYAGNEAFRHATENRFGPGFGYVEAQAMHGFLRSTKPSRIIEVGSGVSTYCMLKAAALNERDTGRRMRVTCIEPFPSQWLRSAGIELITRRVQECDPGLFAELSDGDLLFIDSSHTVTTGGDVPFLILEVLPRLRPGVFVHFHDIYLPYDYPRTADRTFFQWMETAMLHAFLIHNGKDRIVFCLSQLHYDRRDAIREVFPEYKPQQDENGLLPDAYDPFSNHEDHFPSSILLRIG
jgi:predicted O-methyltransferase YrrM